MGELRTASSAFADIHCHVLQDDRVHFKDIWPKLERAILMGEAEPEVTTNTLGFAYHRDRDLYSVYLTFDDGSDEVFLTREDFFRELRQNSIGGGNA